MLINQLNAKNAHPFLSKIPNELWYGVFGGQFDDDLIPGSDKNLNQISRDDLPQNGLEALIVLMIRYPDTPTSELLSSVYGTLNVPNGIILTITDDHTLEGRLDHFVDELALIGRAHNWDRTRLNAQGADEERFRLEENKNSVSTYAHAFKFSGLTGIRELINQPLLTEAPNPSTHTTATNASTAEETHTSPTTSINMVVLGGFITALGIAAVATAFIALNVITLGAAGLVVTSIGVAAILAGVGLFAIGTYQESSGDLTHEYVM